MKTEQAIKKVLEEEVKKAQQQPFRSDDDLIHEGWIEALRWVLGVKDPALAEPVYTEMTSDEAHAKITSVRWKTEECGSENCWCLCVYPEEPIKYQDRPGGEVEEVYIVPSGSLSKNVATRLVELHNMDLE